MERKDSKVIFGMKNYSSTSLQIWLKPVNPELKSWCLSEEFRPNAICSHRHNSNHWIAWNSSGLAMTIRRRASAKKVSCLLAFPVWNHLHTVAESARTSSHTRVRIIWQFTRSIQLAVSNPLQTAPKPPIKENTNLLSLSQACSVLPRALPRDGPIRLPYFPDSTPWRKIRF